MFNKKMALLVAAIMVFAVLLVACQPETVEVVKEVPVEVTRVITETVTEAGQSTEVTRVVTEQVIVTATPEPVAPVSFGAPNPDTYTTITFGDPDTLDPNLAYDTASSGVIMQVMEPLIWYNHKDATTYIPVLANEVPSLENGLISEDGLTYTFNIRPGVTFHDGGTLEAHDVAYTFWRGLLQSDVNGPQWLWLEPILAFSNCYDITEGIDPECNMAGDPDAVKAADPAQLAAVCEQVKAAVVADDAAGTVTFTLAQPWGPFLSTMAGFSYVLDQEWTMAQGDWDGDCATWQNFYSPGSENSLITDKINGTGPYMLDHWTPNEEYVLVANDNYWRADDQPMWDGGPAGVAKIKTVIVKNVNEWGTRFAALQAGDAENVTVPLENESQVDPLVGEICDYKTDECVATDNPDGALRSWNDLPQVSRTDIFMNFDVVTDDQGNNPYIGSGQLDGNGVPANFFSDIHVRNGFRACFDYDTYIADALNGKGIRNNGPIIQDMLGYNPDGPYAEFNLDTCASELALAWDGALPDTGFRVQIVFNTGNSTRQIIGEILQTNLSTVNPNYQVEIVGVPWPTLLRSFRARQLPLAVSGWVEDIHDPHNWVQPFTVGTYAGRQNLPQDLIDQFNTLVTAGVLAADPAEREQIYFELQQLHYDTAIQITGAQALSNRYEQRWVQGWYYRVGQFSSYYYSMSLATE